MITPNEPLWLTGIGRFLWSKWNYATGPVCPHCLKKIWRLSTKHCPYCGTLIKFPKCECGNPIIMYDQGFYDDYCQWCGRRIPSFTEYLETHSYPEKLRALLIKEGLL